MFLGGRTNLRQSKVRGGVQFSARISLPALYFVESKKFKAKSANIYTFRRVSDEVGDA